MRHPIRWAIRCSKRCARCDELHSTTLIHRQSQRCGLCIWEMASRKNRWKRPGRGSKYYCGNTVSHIAECTRCLAFYAVVGPAPLSARPHVV